MNAHVQSKNTSNQKKNRHTTCGTTQSQSKRNRNSRQEWKIPLNSPFRHLGSRVPHTIVVQIPTTDWNNIKHPENIKTKQQKSAYEDFHGKKYDWNRTPMAPLGTKSLTFNDPDQRASWQPHGTDAWYVGPEPEHYRLLKFFNPRTGGYTSTGTFRLYPAHCRTPTISEGDKIIMAAADPVDAMRVTQPKSILERKEWVSALKQQTNILQKPLSPQAQQSEQLRVKEHQEPRVSGTPSTSADPTHPDILRKTKRIHQRTTRNINKNKHS